MKKYIPIFFALCVICIYTALALWQPATGLQGPPSPKELAHFVSFSNEIYQLIGAGLFAILMLGPFASRATSRPASATTWSRGLLCILGVTVISVLLFNPIGIGRWKMDRVADKDARLQKPYLYNRQSSTPDIVFLGTSVSYRIPAQKFAKKLSLTGFNFAVLAGTSVDYYTITNFVLSRATPGKKPVVLVTEVLSPSLNPVFGGGDYYKRYPIEDAIYMPSKFAWSMLSNHIEMLMSYSSFAEIFYVQYHIWDNNWKPRAAHNLASKDGSGAIVPPLTLETAYKNAVINIGPSLEYLLNCRQMDPDGQNLILKMVAMARKQNVSLVFYRSPINDDFYKFLNTPSSDYETCRYRFNHFMKQIQEENPNVFYVDLSNYSPISSGGMNYYLDSHHLNSIGTELTLEILKPTILKAIAYARSR